MSYQQTVERWDQFLKKALNKAEGMFGQAKQGCAMLLDISSLDPIPMSNAWSAIEQQTHELTHLIDDTWYQKVEDMLIELEIEQKQIDNEYHKGQNTIDRLNRQKDETQIDIFSEAAQKLYQAAKEILEKDYLCTQCRAPLPVSNQFFRAVHISCEYCDKTNTFNPGNSVRSVEYFCCHHLSQHKTKELYFKRLDAERRMRVSNFRNYDDMKATEAALDEYIQAYLNARIEIVPEYGESFEKDLNGRMAWFYDEVSYSPVWQKRNPK